MSVSFFISKRLDSKTHSKYTRMIIRLATWATSLSVATMILAVGIIVGFKNNIKDKLFVFWDHAQLSQNINDLQSIIPETPFLIPSSLLSQFDENPLIESYYPYLLKTGILKSDLSMEGIMIKGVQSNFLTKFNIPSTQDFNTAQVLLSQEKAKKLGVKTGDSLMFYFLDQKVATPRVRKLEVYSEFHTGMSEIDGQFALVPLIFLQSLDEYNEDVIHGVQIKFTQHNDIEEKTELLYHQYIEPPMKIFPLNYVYPNIFGWLELLDKNAYIIIIIMAVVAVINLSTALLIFIVDRTSMIGILRALGATGGQIQRIFVQQGSKIALKGIFWGTIVGVSLGGLQEHFKWIKLDESAYYMSYVPVSLVWWHILLIILGAVLMITLALFLPAIFARRIKVLKALKL